MNPTDAQALIDRAMKRDQHALARRLRAAKPDTSARIIEEIQRSVAMRQARADRLPRPTYPLELPVVEKRTELLEAIDRNQVVIICGETGSGKTTQLPKLCLELGRGVSGYIGHTQPRRIAARSVAQRIADELASPLGQTVGYKIRFSDRVSEQTYIKLMTDGILLAESQHDRFLDAYDTIIIDEAHERSLNIDFLLGYLHRLLPRRPDLKLIITSATIDPERFSRHFNDAPIVMVSGRTYPVDVRYRPLQSDDPDEEDAQLMDRIIAGVDEVCREGLGDVLVFLPGEREIRTVAEALRKHHPPGTEILPLYARLSNEEQNRVFHPHGRRRIVLATNVAETSLTVPGIRYVVDPGDARISRYAPRTKVQRLPIEPVSQASANQRMGRCGRISAGVCVRLYSEEDFLARPVFTDPEILRTNLASVILQMKALGLGQIEQFPFIDPPDTRQIRDGYQTLHEIGAIDDKDNLTPLGKKLALLPIDPRIGRMVFAGIEQNVVEEILIIAAALSVQDPRERPLDKQEQADQQHARFRDEQSDFLTYLNLWYFFEEQSAHLSQSKLRKLCRESFLSYVRMREWHDIHQQLRGQLLERHITPARRNDKADQQDGDRFKRVYPAGQYDAIHRSLLSGLLGNIGHRGDGVEYSGARNIRFHLFPGSTLFKAKPLWMMAAELVETTRLYARTCARIQPDWLERIAAHLIHRAYSDPQWNENQQHATINEKVTLYGLPIVAKRTIAMGPVDPAEARRLFIHHALVEPTLRGNPQFLQHNRALVEEIEQLEARTRKRDLLVDMQVRFDFYDARIPPGIYNPQLFQGWRNKAKRENPKLLHMKRDDLMRYTPSELDTTAFPDHLLINGIRLPLEYHLEAGHALDGVTVDIPLAALTQLPDEPFDWLVPGLLVDKLVVLIRSLPKALRTQFVPAPDVAADCAAKLQFAQGNLIEQFARCLGKLRGQNIEPNDIVTADLPVHLRMNYRIRDDRGKELAASRDLRELRTRFRSQAQSTFMQAPPAEFNRDNIVRWDVGDLPERIEIRQKHSTLNGYPALVDSNTSVSLRLLDSRESADRALRVAVRRLFMLQNAKEFSDIWRSLRDSTQLALFYKTLGNADQLRTHLLTAVADLSLYGDQPRAVRTELDYMTLVESAWRNLYPTADRVSSYARDALKLYHQLSLALGKQHTPLAADSIKDMRSQLTKLMPADFLIATPNASLPHLPRYLEGINRRLAKLANAGLARDRQQLAIVAPLEKMLADRATAHQKAGLEDPALAQYRWMLEELRVSLFAQELKTPTPISPKRLEEQWKRVQIVR